MESDHQNLLHLQLEQTVIKILKSSNLDTATELSVRNDAEKLLGVDLSDLASKQLVRRTVESYLLSTSPENEDSEAVEDLPVNYDGGGRIICRLPGMSRVSVKNSEGSKLVSIRKYYDKLGKVFPLGQDTLASVDVSFIRRKRALEGATDKPEAFESITSPGSSNLVFVRAGKLKSKHLVFPPPTTHPHWLPSLHGEGITTAGNAKWNSVLKPAKLSSSLLYHAPKFCFTHASFEQRSARAKPMPEVEINDALNLCRHTYLKPSLSDQLFDEYSVKMLNAKELWESLSH
ncbi:zinc knuckle CCHC-type [Artemisia annua]|uniref:Zinc knuckle CCHC-type n=1 Tax=Artemisia annua TaxID=35608 RepID=A0A2U1L736_ARTAN|nr:zinc knuckle CCHC-type [Artemisia annua]